MSYHKSILTEEQSFYNDYFVLPSHTNYLRKVTYTNEETLIKPVIKNIEGEQGTISIDKIGA